MEKGFSEPMWVISNLQESLEIYSKRKKIDESFRDLKSFLLFEKIMNNEYGEDDSIDIIGIYHRFTFGRRIQKTVFYENTPRQCPNLCLIFRNQRLNI
ncbi:MAG: hypothetical protein ACUVWN_08025 [bacterium]